ncbi:MAG TPA: tetratricopeptide repeat protein [Acidobacteriota bacterium]|nr:tetratricopeptide repeat protein [Acidobacteriota bacterium]
MIGTRLKAVRVILSTAIAAGVGIGTLTEPAQAGGAQPQVQLDCKLVPMDRTLSVWIVELLQSSGAPVRVMTGMNGSTLHMKDLNPGIYTVCIMGTENRQRCESVDLNLPPNKKFFRFIKRFEPPLGVLHASDTNKVSLARLGIPARAREEMRRSQQEQLRGDTGKAMSHLEEAIKIAPDYADALNNLGTYYHRQGDYAKSIEYFDKVTKLDPGFYGGWVNLAGSLISKGQFREALEANKRAYGLRPKDIQVVSQMALNYFYLHDLSQAREYFERVIKMDPASPIEPQLYLVHIALAEQHKDEAARYIREFLKVHPNAPQAQRMKETLANMNSLIFTSDEFSPSKQ